MILKRGLILLSLYTFVPKCCGIDTENLKAFIELTDIFYEDACQSAADADWKLINDPTNHTLILAWEQAQTAYSIAKKREICEIHNLTDVESDDSLLLYKLSLAKKPGDTLLNTTEFKKLLSFSGKATALRTGANYTDGPGYHSRRDIESLLSGNAKLEDKRSAWSNWHCRLSPLTTNFSSTLGLVSEAAKANDVNNVVNYWELLSGYSNGYNKIEDMWYEISELHKKLVSFVQNRLAQKYKVTLSDEGIPAYLLGSLTGNDWTMIAADLIPYGNVTYSIKKGLWEKNLRGKVLYESASKIGESVFNKVPEADFWKTSIFNQTCDTQLVNFCLGGATRVSTCHHASLGNFLSAYKVVAKVLISQMERESYPVLNIANRYSGLDEGVAELFSILSVSPEQLHALGLIDNSTDTDHAQITSLMITALDVFPRLAYYISADLWRMNVIKNGTYQQDRLLESWWQYRKQYEGVTADSVDIPTFLDDHFITSNKPYLSKFVGTVLAFQLYEYLTGSTEVRYDGTAKYQINQKLRNMIQEGGSDDWTKVIRAFLEIDEITTDALLQYFNPLIQYLDKDSRDSYSLTAAQESDIKHFEELYDSVDVTSAPATTTTTAVPPLIPKEPKVPSVKANSSLPIPPSIISHENSTKKAKDEFSWGVEETPEDSENTSYTDKMSTSKAVWAVAAVLVATVTICIIAIFGRRRCVKSQTPKNRRYV